MNDWRDRVIAERDDLTVKLDRLSQFINRASAERADISREMDALLIAQFHVMTAYLTILNTRLYATEKPRELQ